MTFASLRAMWANFSSAISKMFVWGCWIRPAENQRPGSCSGPLSKPLLAGEKRMNEGGCRRAEAVAVFPLEPMPCKLLCLGKLLLLLCVEHCFSSGSSFCCSMFYCPCSNLSAGTCSLVISAQEHLQLDPLPYLTEVSRSLGLFSPPIYEMWVVKGF